MLCDNASVVEMVPYCWVKVSGLCGYRIGAQRSVIKSNTLQGFPEESSIFGVSRHGQSAGLSCSAGFKLMSLFTARKAHSHDTVTHEANELIKQCNEAVTL